jgi:hypothetical protein
MSWSELERLVEEAEADRGLARALRHCRSRGELVLAARRLGYRITRTDLHRAWQLCHVAEPAGACEAGATTVSTAAPVAAAHGPSIPFQEPCRRGA